MCVQIDFTSQHGSEAPANTQTESETGIHAVQLLKTLENQFAFFLINAAAGIGDRENDRGACYLISQDDTALRSVFAGIDQQVGQYLLQALRVCVQDDFRIGLFQLQSWGAMLSPVVITTLAPSMVIRQRIAVVPSALVLLLLI